MNIMVAFDTLSYAKKLKSAGFSETQAEVQAEALAEVFETNLATKQDLANLRRDLKQDVADLRRDIETLRTEVKNDIATVRSEIDQMGMKLTIRLGGMLVVAVGVLAAMRYFGG